MSKKGNYHRKRIKGKVRFIEEGKSENKLDKNEVLRCDICEEPRWEVLGKIDDTGFTRYKRLECACDYHKITTYGTRLDWR